LEHQPDSNTTLIAFYDAENETVYFEPAVEKVEV